MLFLIFSSLTVSRFIVAESMEAEKKRSKGGFLNLFDWNGKSRKKLFANIPEELPGNFFFLIFCSHDIMFYCLCCGITS